MLKPETRRYFRRAHRLLLAHRDSPDENERADEDRMLRFTESLLQACALKEAFCGFMSAKSSPVAAALLKDWFDADDQLKLPEFKVYYRMLRNWKPYILHSSDVPFSNGYTEGRNNGTRTLKRVCFGIPCSSYLRAYILLTNVFCPIL
jgi:transposase